MKNLFTRKALAACASLFTMLAVATTANAESIGPGSNTVTISRNNVVEIVPTVSGTVTLSVPTSTQLSDSRDASIIYSDAAHTAKVDAVYGTGSNLQTYTFEATGETPYFIFFSYWLAPSSELKCTVTLEVASTEPEPDSNLITLAAGETLMHSVAQGQVYTIVLESDGEFSATYSHTSSSGISTGYTLFKDAAHNNGIEDTNFKYDKNTKMFSYSVPLEAGTYYLFCQNSMWFNGAMTVTFQLSEGEPEPEPQEFEIYLNDPITLAKGDIGIFNKPEHAPVKGSYNLIIATTSSTDLGTFLYEEKGSKSPVNASSKQQTETGWVYTFSIYPAWCPYYITQNNVAEVTYTLTMPQIESQPFEIGTPRSFEKNYIYSFDLQEDCKLSVKVAYDIDNYCNNMIYVDPACSTRVNCYNLQSVEPDEEGVYDYLYIIDNPGTYYFLCPRTDTFTFSIVKEVVDTPPSEVDASLESPLPGQQAFSSLGIYWDGNVLSDGTMRGVKLTLPDGEEVTSFTYNLTTRLDEEGITILSVNPSPTRVFMDEGTYTVYVPEGVVLVDGAPNKEQTIQYELKADLTQADEFEDPNYTVTPSETAILASLDMVTVTYAYDLYYTSLNAESATVQVNGEDVEAMIVKSNSLAIPVNVAGATEAQEVVIFIPKAIVRNNVEAVNPEATLVFNLLPLTTVEPTVDPIDGTVFEGEEVEAITVTVEWANEPLSIVDLDTFAVVLTDSNGQKTMLAYYEGVEFNEEATALVIELGELSNGTYTLTIPEGSLFVGETLNAEVVVTYDVEIESGVAGIEAEGGVYRVYNLQGMKVMETTSGATLKTLKGLYIINGKKVVL